MRSVSCGASLASDEALPGRLSTLKGYLRVLPVEPDPIE
ncbi:hypothetical protein JMJ77_0003641 [Colletotrichum scovillei]|uniref:Uncharacterized protein n=1 Tax=Colletotrichum scovillei TaxID=1209932 RepID=A0A9P7QUW4_9PEZI|nr:hypothetical protein JMJ78_0005152 [Colletotrichum scovillei]KAG7041538.1 hypothetical protein JMJ77_0003641 [Colletotrichum scovillei]KAG7061566.1 hypothetical protein JMJ76_0001127 [Colletotrichum scovillei]